MEDNPVMMRCTKCGEMNRLPVVHCKQCGDKLDFDAAEAHIHSAGQPSLLAMFRMHIKIGVAFLMLLAILLMLWPSKMTRLVGDEMDVKRYRLKGELLVDALNRNAAATQTITEKEVNAFLFATVLAQPMPAGRFAAKLEDAAVRFFPERAEIFIVIARGPLTFSTTIYLKSKGPSWKVTGAKAGHLPLPSFLGKLYSATQEGLLKNFKSESRIVRNMNSITMNAESVEIVIQGTSDVK